MTTRRQLLAGLAVTGLLRSHARAETVTLRVGDQKGGTQSVMKAAGVLDGLPYRLDWSQFAAAAPLLEALNASAVDLAFAGDAPTTFALAAGLRARIISPIRTSGAGTAILVSENSPIHEVADLKGRTVAVNRGSIGHALVLAAAESQGWDFTAIKIANLLPAEAKSALSTGAVDAWCSWGVYVAQARLIDQMRVVVDGGGGLLTGLSYLVATNDAISRRPDALLDFSHRLAVARRWAQAHPDDYARVLAAEIGVTQPVARLVFDTELPVPIPIDARVVADEQKTADRYLAAGIIHARLDANRVFDASFNEALAG
jgi:sulfonate transport system substrate-binding protein